MVYMVVKGVKKETKFFFSSENRINPADLLRSKARCPLRQTDLECEISNDFTTDLFSRDRFIDSGSIEISTVFFIFSGKLEFNSAVSDNIPLFSRTSLSSKSHLSFSINFLKSRRVGLGLRLRHVARESSSEPNPL